MSPIIKKWSHPLAGNDETPLSQLMQLAKADSGFYPIGKNGLLHGGVHFDKSTHPSLGSSAVRCIADGEVIAYRIDSEYPTTNYPQNQGACFSTGFVLVRHRLEPTVPDGTPPPPSLTLYSLYMHLQSWAGYQANASQDRPAFWDEKTYRVATQDGNLLVRAEANSNGTELGSLPRGTRVRVAPGDGEYRKLLEIVDGPLSSTLRPDANGHMPGYVAAGYLRPEKEPALIDDVHVPNTPIAIAAGDLIGHPGLYQNRTDSSAEPLLHLEVFSCDDVEDYLKKIRKWADDNRHTTPKTLLKVHAGSSMLIADRPNANTRPDSNRDKTVGISLIIPQSYLDALPTGYKIATGAQPDHITHWWRLDNLLADAQGQFISGWLAEQNYITTRHSPWEWHDFDHIEDTDLPKNSLAYLLNALRCLTDSELASYRGLIDQSDKGPVKSRLYDIIDTNRDGQITHAEIKAAIQKPWHAQSIAQLILRQQSEWFWDKEKWNSLDDLLLTSDPGWEFEKQRIEKLSWWDKVDVLPEKAIAWYFHPIILGCFLGARDNEDDIKWLKVPKGQLTFDAEGNDNDSSIYFSRVPHWPGGNSGVTIGRGYDIGHQADVRADLESAGITEPLLSWLENGQGIKGQEARHYLDTSNEQIRRSTISRRQQYMLFIRTYTKLENDVRRICAKRDTIEAFGETDWENTHPRIKEILIDLRYRGDYTPRARTLIQVHVANNDMEAFRQAIQDRSKWQSIPDDRFLRRSNLLNQRQP